jgi:hypothetical protein
MNLFDKIKLSKRSDNVEISKCFKRCLANADGEKILNYLTQMTLERVTPSSTSSDELRHIEGQRFIVKLILNYSLN